VSDKAELRDMLFNDNAQMQCKHCSHRRNYKPTTHFKNHLLAGCLPFQATEAWNSKDVQDALKKKSNKVRQFIIGECAIALLQQHAKRKHGLSIQFPAVHTYLIVSINNRLAT
jgi:DNA-directed RNA polymerase subunit RPC12/RpoP